MERGYNNMQREGIELNLLCIGELQAGKSSFLAHYTGSENTDEHYKIFAQHEAPNTTVFLHEIQEKEGMEVYLKYPYDGILFFVNVVSFHNTASGIMQSLLLFSQHSGINVFKIPIMAVLMAQKVDQEYEHIEKADKNRFIEEVSRVISQKQIIYVESDNSYRVQLRQYYDKLIKEERQDEAIGIKQSIFAQWHLRGLCFFFSFDTIKLHLMRAYQEAKYSSIFAKLLKSRNKKKRD